MNKNEQWQAAKHEQFSGTATQIPNKFLPFNVFQVQMYITRKVTNSQLFGEPNYYLRLLICETKTSLQHTHTQYG